MDMPRDEMLDVIREKGRVVALANEQQRQKTAGVTHEVAFRNDETGGVIPKCFGWCFRGRNAAASMYCGLDAPVYGSDKKWVATRDGVNFRTGLGI